MRLDDLPDEVEFPYDDEYIDIPSDDDKITPGHIQAAFESGRAAAAAQVERLRQEIAILRSQPRYPHRNGETDEPTVDGYYWIAVAYKGETLYVMRNRFNSEWLGDGRPSNTIGIYGPIPKPRGE